MLQESAPWTCGICLEEQPEAGGRPREAEVLVVAVPDGHAKAGFAGEYRNIAAKVWEKDGTHWVYLDSNDYWMLTNLRAEVDPVHGHMGHIHSLEKAAGRGPAEVMESTRAY